MHYPRIPKIRDVLPDLYGASFIFDLERQALLLILFFCSMIFLLSGLNNYYLALPSVRIPLIMSVVSLGFYWMVHRDVYWARKLTLAPFVIYIIVTTDSWFTNAGIMGSVPIFLSCPIITAVIILKGKQRIVVILTLLAHLAGLTVIHAQFPALILPYPSFAIKQADIQFSVLLTILYCLGCVSLVMHHLDQRREQAESLLLNVLPHAIAEKLTYRFTGTETMAESFPHASIIFIDIVNFTSLSAAMRPDELVTFLNDLFSHFDMLAEAYGIEKIKTIGDCYMAAAGVPYLRPDHAQVLIRFALTLQAHSKRQHFYKEPLNFRIGVNSGPVVAGIIGKQKFAYDLWGDAVNLASRMESQGEPGTIQITRTTYEAIANDFVCIYKGMIHVKGKGDTEIWHVTGMRPEPAQALRTQVEAGSQRIAQLRYRESYANQNIG